MILGKDLEEIIFQLIDSPLEWMVRRPMSKNQDLKIEGICFTGMLSNSVLGYCMTNGVNVIITLEEQKIEYICNYKQDILELIYKNDLYPLSLSKLWIFNRKIGHIILNQIFGGFESTIWNSEGDCVSVNITYNHPQKIKAVLNRYLNCIFVSNSELEDIMKNNITQLMIGTSESLFTNNVHMGVQLVITSELNSKLISHCLYNKIILVFIHWEDILNEISKELYFILGNLYPQYRILFYQNRKIKIRNYKDGLNGI